MELTPRHRVIGSLVALALSFATGPVAAQGEPGADGTSALAIDLNGTAQVDGACRFTFVIRNGLSANIGKSVFEFALFNKRGLVARLPTLDFKELPKGKTRVRQFDLADLNCGELARVLVNDARECSGEGVEPASCMANLKTTTATDLEFGN